MKVDYSQAKIYKMTNDANNDIWIGSTCDTLVKKFSIKMTLLEILGRLHHSQSYQGVWI